MKPRRHFQTAREMTREERDGLFKYALGGAMGLLLYTVLMGYLSWQRASILGTVFMIFLFGYLAWLFLPAVIDAVMNEATIASGMIIKTKSFRNMVTTYTVTFGSGTLKVGKELWLALESGKSYQIAYARNSRYLLSAMPLDNVMSAQHSTSALNINSEKQLPLSPALSEPFEPVSPPLTFEGTLAFPEGQKAALIRHVLMYRLAFALPFLLLGIVGVFGNWRIVALGLIVLGLTILALSIMPAWRDISEGALIQHTGRVNRENHASLGRTNAFVVELNGVELASSYGMWESIRDGVVYKVVYTQRTKFVVSATMIESAQV